MRMRKIERRQYEAFFRGEHENVVTVGYAMIAYIRENPMATFTDFSKEFPGATSEQYHKACNLA